MTARDDDVHAFPIMRPTDPRIEYCDQGMTLRQYAAIKLCVPDSGLEWLDDMIRQAQRDRFAGQALIAPCAGAADEGTTWEEKEDLATDAWNLAHAMIAERKGGAA
jgi:hypothetical protein